MGWDVALLRVDGDPDDFPSGPRRLLPLGDASWVRARLTKVLGPLGWHGPRAQARVGELTLDLVLWSTDEPVSSGPVERVEIAFHGGGDARTVLRALCLDAGWQACDWSRLDLVPLAGPDVGPRRWLGLFRFDGPPRLDGDGVLSGMPLGSPVDVRAWLEEALPGLAWEGDTGRAELDGCRYVAELVTRGDALVQVELFACPGVQPADVDRRVRALCDAHGLTAIDWHDEAGSYPTRW